MQDVQIVVLFALWSWFYYIMESNRSHLNNVIYSRYLKWKLINHYQLLSVSIYICWNFFLALVISSSSFSLYPVFLFRLITGCKAVLGLEIWFLQICAFCIHISECQFIDVVKKIWLTSVSAWSSSAMALRMRAILNLASLMGNTAKETCASTMSPMRYLVGLTSCILCQCSCVNDTVIA